MSFLLIAHTIIVVSLTLRILLRDDLSPPARLAWIIVLILLPVAGTVAYFLFGEINLGRRAHAIQLTVRDEIYRSGAALMGDPGTIEAQIVPQFQPVAAYAASINGFQPVMGNAAQLMADAADTRKRMVADIDAATDHVNALYYIWLGDRTGIELSLIH